MKQEDLKRMIRERMESDPEIKKLLSKISSTLESIDTSIDFVASSVSGLDALDLELGQAAMGRIGPTARAAARRRKADLNESSFNGKMLKDMIIEELGKIREAAHFDGLVVTALGPGDEEVVRMSWANEPDIDVLGKTLVSTYLMGAVEALQAVEGEDWLMSNIDGINSQRVREVAREALGLSRFSDDEMDRDRQLDNPSIDDDGDL
jgi:hypothetical protein